MLTNLKTGETTYEGMTLGTRDNIYQGCERMLDFVEVWTGSGIKSISYGGGNSYGTGQEWQSYRVTVDATPEVKALAQAWRTQQSREAEVARQKAIAFRLKVEAEKEAARKAKGAATRSQDEKTLASIKKGEMVTISSGVSKGFTGTMFWVGSPKDSCIRVGVKNAKGEVAWANARACSKALIAA